jgi:hypothetical protein
MAICCVSLILRRCGVLLNTPPAGSPTRRRGKKSLLIRRDATLRISGALHLTIFEQPGKDDFFHSLLDLKERNVYGRDDIFKEFEHPKYFLLTTER